MRRALAAVALLLTAVMAWDAASNFREQPGIDFYHLWGVGTVHARLGGNPYSDTPAYLQDLNALADAGSPRLQGVNRHHRTYIAPTGTPLFYTVFALLPRDYDFAYAAFVAAQFAALLAAVTWMAALRGESRWAGLAAGALLAMTFAPFIQDVKFGNVNTFQVLVLVGLIALLGPRRETPRRDARDLIVLPLAAFLVAFKPNLALVVPALALCHALRHGPRRTALAAALCVPVLALAWALPVAYFRDAGIWGDWVRYTQGMNGGTLLYPAHEGNQSLAKLMSEMRPALGPLAYGLLLAAALAFLLFAAITSLGKRIRGLGARLLALAADPWAATGLALLFTFASTPMLWPHYATWALVVFGWLFRRQGRIDAASAWCIVTWVLLSRPLLSVLLDARAFPAIEAVLRLGWLPLVAAAAAYLSAKPPREM